MAVSHRIAVVVSHFEIIEQDPALWSVTIGRPARNNYNSPLPGYKQPVEQSVYKNKMAEVIDRKMLLNAVGEFEVIAAAAVARVTHKNVHG